MRSVGQSPITSSCRLRALTTTITSNHLACLVGCGLVVSQRRGRFVFDRHADDHVSLLLRVADEIVRDPIRANLECPRCGVRL